MKDSIELSPFSALTGAAVIHALTPSSRRGSLGALELRNSTTHWQGFALESIMGFMVSFVFLSGTDPNREDGCFGCALAYGSVTVGAHLLAVCLSLHLGSVPPCAFLAAKQ